MDHRVRDAVSEEGWALENSLLVKIKEVTIKTLKYLQSSV